MCGCQSAMFHKQVTWLVVTEVWSDKLRTGYRAPPLQSTSYLHILLLCCERCIFSSSSVVSCTFSAHACTMRVFDVRASSAPWGYPCTIFRFCRVPPIVQLARGEKLDAHSLTHSASLFDMLETEVITSVYKHRHSTLIDNSQWVCGQYQCIAAHVCLSATTDQCPLQSFNRLTNDTVSINFTDLVANMQRTWCTPQTNQQTTLNVWCVVIKNDSFEIQTVVNERSSTHYTYLN